MNDEEKSILSEMAKIIEERDNLRTAVTRLRVVPPPLPPGYSPDAFVILGNILSKGYDENPLQAAERVVKKNEALQQELEAIRVAVKANSKKSTLQEIQTLCQAFKEACATPQAMARVLGVNADGSLQQMLLGCEAQREEVLQTLKDRNAIHILTGAHDAETTLDAVARVANLCKDLCKENVEVLEVLNIGAGESILGAAQRLKAELKQVAHDAYNCLQERDKERVKVRKLHEEIESNHGQRISALKEREIAMSQCEIIREYLGAQPEEDTLDLVKRVVALLNDPFSPAKLQIQLRKNVQAERSTQADADRFLQQRVAEGNLSGFCAAERIVAEVDELGEMLNERISPAEAKRIVEERNTALKERDMHASRAENFRDQLDSRDYLIGNIRNILGHPNENLEEAARRGVKGAESLLVLPRDMASALGISTVASPEDTIEACRAYREEYTKMSKARQALLSQRRDIMNTLDLLDSAPHTETLAVLRDLTMSKARTKLEEKEKRALRECQEKRSEKELEDLRVGDLVCKPHGKEYYPVERVGQGHAGYWYVYLDGGGWEPQSLVRKPVEKGDKARCVSGPFKGEFVVVLGVDRNYVEMVREGYVREGYTQKHVIDKDMVVAVKKPVLAPQDTTAKDMSAARDALESGYE